MIQFANAKINIGLHILGKRTDGFHDLETVFYPIPLFDVVEVIESGDIGFESSGLPIPGGIMDNLCIKAYQILKRDFKIPPVWIYLHKTIPIGAGLGGGSSDAVATLSALNLLFELGMGRDALEGYARQLGSDCAFFVRNVPSFAQGRGDQLEEVPLDLAGYHLLLIKPNVHIATAEAYRRVLPRLRTSNLRNAIEYPLCEWSTALTNDFEAALFPIHPVLKTIKDLLLEHGALYASMSGSGSAIYGIFSDRIPAEAINFLQKQVPECRIFELDFPA